MRIAWSLYGFVYMVTEICGNIHIFTLSMKKIIGIIPARWGSTRFPGKPLTEILGKPMVQHVYERAMESGVFHRVIVATDHLPISEHILGIGGEAMMTSDSHESGTDRIAEVATIIEDAEYIINIQGDEPFVSIEHIKRLADVLKTGTSPIATLAYEVETTENDSNRVKVVVNGLGNALYFSRASIPYGSKRQFYHIGMYGFERETLLEIVRLKVSELENIEKLEQLRWMDNGYPIKVEIVDKGAPSVDRPEDIEKVIEWCSKNSRE